MEDPLVDSRVLSAADNRPTRTTGYVIMAAVMAALGGILFGYDIGIISGALLQVKEDFELNCRQQELVVSLLLIGAFIGAMFGGFLVDCIGRRLSIILNSVIFILGATILAFAPIYEVLIIGRLICGFAVSLSAIAECTYISEISPMTKRGRLVCVNEIGITLGILLAYLVNYLLITTPSGWRYMFGLSVLPALIQGSGMVLLPPSPRFLMKKGKEAQARTVLRKLRGTDLIEMELVAIRNSAVTEHDYKACDVFSSVNNMRGRFLIGVGLVFFQQATGQTNVLYYAPTIFQSVGFGSDTAAMLATVGLGIVKVISTSICLCFVDRAGRRHFLLAGAFVMTFIIITLGIITKVAPPVRTQLCFTNGTEDQPVSNGDKFDERSSGNQYSARIVMLSRFTQNDHLRGISENENGTESATSDAPDNMPTLGVVQITTFISLTLYVAAYSYGFGPVTWLVLSEIFPVGIRGRASSLASIFNWGTNVLVSLTFLDVMNKIGTSWTFLIYGMICALSFFFIYCIVPETKGRSLEQISAELTNKSAMTGLSGHCCLQRIAVCSSCCHGYRAHHRLVQDEPVNDEYSVELEMTETRLYD